MNENHMPQDRPLLTAAWDYAQQGLSLIPIKTGTKLPAVRSWKKYQSTRAAKAELEKWFLSRSAGGLAAIMGQVSEGLGCRDFDKAESYSRWSAEHAGLAATLPTVETSPGRRHVFFHTCELSYVEFDDGEYRADCRHYCLLPPSKHPNGHVYRWLIPPPVSGFPYVEDVRLAGFLQSYRNVTESTECTESTEKTESTEAIESGSIRELIKESLPKQIGRRHRQTFELVRTLKGVPALADAKPQSLRTLVKHWHRLGVARGVIATIPFEETWIDFLIAWRNVRFPKGSDPMAKVLQLAKERKCPNFALKYEQDELRLLVSICRELQRIAGDEPFFISCRTASRLLFGNEANYVKASRWLFLLREDRVLKEISNGENTRRASRYRYLKDVSGNE